MVMPIAPDEPAARINPVPQRITVLGSTGSVGVNTLDLAGRNPDRFEIAALTAHTNVADLAAQARQFRPELAVIADESRHEDLKAALAGTGIATAAGPQGMNEAASLPADLTMAAIVGSAGLEPTLTAVKQGGCIALANKECLVSAGDLFLREIARHGTDLVPVDSEHSAIFQVLDNTLIDQVDKIVLTASGGPFRTLPLADMAKVTRAEALAHPNWEMGAKISIDSATMMNKGLELIEAHYLFGIGTGQLDVLVHPQSIIHSFVSYVDGSVLAQMGMPDMRTPIAHALAWPQRMEAPVPKLDLAAIGSLHFEAPDPVRFPALRLAREALERGRGAPTVFNAANEMAVAAFLEEKCSFLNIARVVEDTLLQVERRGLLDLPGTLAEVLELDRATRAIAKRRISRL